MGRFTNDQFTAEFIIGHPVEQVWAALEAEKSGEPLWLSAWPRMPGFKSTGVVVESVTPRRLRVVKESEPCKDSEILLTLEEVDGGTGVVVVQSQLPAWTKQSPEAFVLGGNQIVADLILYLERGVVISRHAMPWAFPGFVAREVATGLEVTAVIPGGFAAGAGLVPGDLLMTLGGAPVFTQLCLQALLRVFKSGDKLEVIWVRGRQQQTGSGVL